MSHNIALKGICISDFTRLKDLSGIEKAKNLEVFSMGDAVWSTTTVDSYMPFADSPVKHLEFFGKSIKDENLSFIETMPNLEQFDFPPSLFSTEKIAWAVSNCPHIKGTSLTPLLKTWIYSEKEDRNIPAFSLPGKGKRSFRAENEKRKQKCLNDFQAMVKKYKGIPYCDVFY